MDPVSRPVVKKRTLADIQNEKCLYVVLEDAPLEVIKQKDRFELLHMEEHHNELRKRTQRDPKDYRPDIVHQCLLSLLDSPLNQAGKLRVYIHTSSNVLIEVNPATRIPRTYRRFAFLMVQLLQKLSVRADNGPMKLLSVVKNPVTDHLPSDAPVVALEYAPGGEPVGLIRRIREKYGNEDAGPVVFVIGATAHHDLQIDYAEESLSISSYPLSAALCCSKTCTAFEEAWNIL